MRLFRLRPDDNNWGKRYKYDVDARHKWALPGLKCDTCGQTWATTGVQYPLVVPDKELSAILAQLPFVVGTDDFIKVVALLRKQVAPELLIKPGTTLGPLVGRSTGESPGTAWLNPWTLLVNERGLEALEASDLQHAGVAATQLQSRRKHPEKLYEIQIEPRIALSKNSFSEYSEACGVCGRITAKLERIVVDKRTIPIDLDLFRPYNFPTVILATELFIDICMKNEIAGTIWEEIEA